MTENEREAVREAAKLFGEANRVEGVDGWQLMADFAIEYAKPKWVAVSERLPKANGRYVTQDKSGALRVQDYDSHRTNLWLMTVLAYQSEPIQPYTDSDNTEVSDA